MQEQSYKVLEAARLLGVSKNLLIDYERDGKIPESKRDRKGNRFYTGEDVENLRRIIGVQPRLSAGPMVVAFFNMKGGVGKSTVSSNFAWKVSKEGFRTLAVDADPQGHMTTSLGLEPSEFRLTLQHLLIPSGQRETVPVTEVRTAVSPNLHIVPANLSMCSLNLLLFQQPEREYRLRRAMQKIRELHEYDLVVIDSPPSYDLTSLNILLSCDFLLAPVKLDGNSFYGLEYLFDAIRDIAATYRYTIPTVKIIPNQYNSSFSVSRQILQGLRKNYGDHVAKTVVRQDVSFDKANALREPVFVSSPSCKGSKDMANLSTELTNIIEERNAEKSGGKEKK